MPSPATDSDSWKRMVLQSMAPPAWLREEGPHRDIVLSTRVRFMRNLRGRRFPHRAAPDELRDILEVIKAAVSAGLNLELVSRPSPMERDYLVAGRLVSPDFDWNAPGRAAMLDADRSVSILVNEEDHLRIQALAAGWSLVRAAKDAKAILNCLGERLEFAAAQPFGYLAASPANCGEGLRYSAMFHLIGLAHTKRLPDVIRALHSQGLVVRGLFGERSRAVGAFVQVSSTAGAVPQFTGACEYLLEQEARARQSTAGEAIAVRRRAAGEWVEARQSIGLGDALRLLAWRRWDDRPTAEVRAIDALLPELALLESLGEPRAGRARVQLLRRVGFE